MFKDLESTAQHLEEPEHYLGLGGIQAHVTPRDIVTIAAWRKRETREDSATTSLATRSAVVVPIHVDQGQAVVCWRRWTPTETHEKVPTEDASLDQEHLKKQQSDRVQIRID